MFELTETGKIQENDEIMFRKSDNSLTIKVMRDNKFLFLNEDGEKEIIIPLNGTNTLCDLMELFFHTLFRIDFQRKSEETDWVAFTITKASKTSNQ